MTDRYALIVTSTGIREIHDDEVGTDKIPLVDSSDIPLVLISGYLCQIPTGDTLILDGGGSGEPPYDGFQFWMVDDLPDYSTTGFEFDMTEDLPTYGA